MLRLTQPMPTPTLAARLPSATASLAPTQAAAAPVLTTAPAPARTASPSNTPPDGAAPVTTAPPATHTPEARAPGPAVTPTPLPDTAPTTPAETDTPPPTDSATASPAVTPTLTVAATATPMPLAIRHDTACLDGAGRIYIYGEIVNTAALPYRAALSAQIFGAGGALPAADPVFDMPGRFVVPAGQALPFVLSAGWSQPAFSRYTLELTAEASEATPASTVRLDDFTAAAEADVVTVAGRWTNTGSAPVSEYVDVYAAAYDAQGRVTNLQYETITAQVQLTPGQHSFRLFLDPAAPCGTGTVAAGVVGE
ncbi:MAG: hypothetical protein JNK29_13525 [Anaerolineales bacterium]|nr:hypothetical protein [Anaerolineales bacterium]